MNKKEEELVPQDAPSKNTDRAFVQVGKDGEPVIPATDKKPEQDREEDGPGHEDRLQHAASDIY